MNYTSFFSPINIRMRIIQTVIYTSTVAVVLMDLMVWRPN